MRFINFFVDFRKCGVKAIESVSYYNDHDYNSILILCLTILFTLKVLFSYDYRVKTFAYILLHRYRLDR